MEIWQQSPHVESNNRIIASQPQSMTQLVEVPFQQEVPLTTLDYGEMIITIIKGKGFVVTAEEKHPVSAGDQIYLKEGDTFSLTAASQDEPFVAQSHWASNIMDQLC
jgi:quercetin dioxygenase-like cupin family protein